MLFHLNENKNGLKANGLTTHFINELIKVEARTHYKKRGGTERP